MQEGVLPKVRTLNFNYFILKQIFIFRLLEEKFWDFKVALACFNVDMGENKISDEVFNFK